MSEGNVNDLKTRYWNVHRTNRNDLYDDKVLSVGLENEGGTQSMTIKWDGCCNYLEYGNGFSTRDIYSEELEQNTNYLHICSIKRRVKEMQEIVDIAEQVFSTEDFECYWE